MINLVAAISAFAAVYLSLGFLYTLFIFIILLCLGVLYGLLFHYRWVYVVIKTLPRDLKALICLIKVQWRDRKLTKRNWTVPDVFHDVVQRHPNKPCFLFEDEVWAYKEVEDFSLRVTAALKAQGVTEGSIVGFLVSNCPQLPAMWMGNARLGGISPLINTNQRGSALIHSINIAKCDIVIFSEEYLSAIEDISSQLSPSLKLFKFTHRSLNSSGGKSKAGGDNILDFTALLETTPPAPWTLANGEGFNGKFLYIYTSGTTGLPKAAVLSHSRLIFLSSGAYYLSGMVPTDIVYCPLPLYHGTGRIIAMGFCLISGVTLVLKPKFSASQYFSDCAKYNATVAFYVGEMCRYVLATPPSPADKQHKVRMIYGNGLRKQIWSEFATRFNIKHICEFYASSEGNASTVNMDGKEGAVGFLSRISPNTFPIAIIRIDEKGDPVRDSRGLCQLTQPNEPGVIVGKISNTTSRAFLGYADKAASEKKIIRDVFTHGDSAYNSVNMDGKEGAVGFLSRISPNTFPIAIIRIDEKGDPVRDSRGLCQLTQPNEPGVIVGKISNTTSRAFLGYADKAASEKKIIRDVFTHGDSAYNSGDILVADELGYLYFRDRTGDTFRWRGENVSTAEVEAAISRITKHSDVVVYGVLVPNTEGRAGMCGIVEENGTLDLDKLAQDLVKDLPAYARPIFVRVMTSIELTGTFRIKKVYLQKEGFDPNVIKKDKIYYLDPKLGKYLPLGPEEYEKINSGTIRL